MVLVVGLACLDFNETGAMMRETLVRLDDGLIDRVFQRWVDWISGHLTFDCFRLARIFIDLAALAWILSQAGGVVAAFGSAVPGQAAMRGGLLMVGLAAITVLRTLFQKVGGDGQSAGRANPLRAGMLTHRLLCHVWLVGLLVKTAGAPFGLEAYGVLAVGVCATLAAYFGACSNPPPKHRRYVEHRGWKLASQASR
jgi:hypothetical protein